MTDPTAVPAAQPRTVAVPLPDDAGEPVAAPVATPAVRPRAVRRARHVVLADTDLGPDIPVTPLAPGEFDRYLADQPGEVGEQARARLDAAAGRAADDAPVTVADAVPALRRLLADPNISAADAAALVLALSRVTDAAREAPSARPLCELTHAELCERVAECDTRRAQLLAAIAAAGRPTPGGGGDSRRA